MKKTIITLALVSIPFLYSAAQVEKGKGKSEDKKPKTEQPGHEGHDHDGDDHPGKGVEKRNQNADRSDTFHENNPVKGGEVKDKGPDSDKKLKKQEKKAAKKAKKEQKKREKELRKSE